MAGLTDDHIQPRPGTHLRDAAAHQPGADDTYAADVVGGAAVRDGRGSGRGRRKGGHRASLPGWDGWGGSRFRTPPPTAAYGTGGQEAASAVGGLTRERLADGQRVDLAGAL
ncbi:hypothetical protein GCM10022232_64950 [Streptomyces plumbiresistens]|uniref:Uncharacterized protein n=1 Tax=Streptomyces plumbiresistens TaxID=511811 RepID=A0ABP7SLT8_9ACTN